jgi:hypothetical protein
MAESDENHVNSMARWHWTKKMDQDKVLSDPGRPEDRAIPAIVQI